MPKSTFNNLSDERKKEIISACRAEFEENKLSEASVASIVTRLGVARGTFYKYFKDIEACYFYILSTETREIHELFFDLFKGGKVKLHDILDEYGEKVADEIHKKDNYELYKNRYLGWTPAVQMRWDDYCKENKVRKTHITKMESKETLFILKAVIHNLVERNFIENWSKKKFLKKYKKQMGILKKGIRG